MNLIFFGAPGVGKGTQAEKLAERLGIPHISTGAIFRAAMQEGSELGLSVKQYYDKGELVPDELTTAIVVDTLRKPAFDDGFILDGFPRNLAQAEALQSALEEQNRSIDRVLYLTAPEEEIVSRMLARGRNDDTRDVIENRLKVYRSETEPVLDFYRERNHVINVDGVGDIDQVHERVFEATTANVD
jgi:adenylate kinase